MTRLVEFRATEKGYYGDVMRVPGGPHATFMVPEDFSCSWAERVDGKRAPIPTARVSADTIDAEALLAHEAQIGISEIPGESTDASNDIPGETADASDDIPAEISDASIDVNEATGVEVL